MFFFSGLSSFLFNANRSEFNVVVTWLTLFVAGSLADRPYYSPLSSLIWLFVTNMLLTTQEFHASRLLRVSVVSHPLRQVPSRLAVFASYAVPCRPCLSRAAPPPLGRRRCGCWQERARPGPSGRSVAIPPQLFQPTPVTPVHHSISPGHRLRVAIAL